MFRTATYRTRTIVTVVARAETVRGSLPIARAKQTL